MADSITKIKKKSERKAKRKQILTALGLMSPFIIIFVVFTFIPVFMGFVFSFMQYNPYDSSANGFIGLQNFIRLFDFSNKISVAFWESFLTLLAFDAVMVPTLMIIPFIFAYLINSHPPGYKIFRAILYFPSVVSISVLGIVFGNMFAGNDTGLINSIFGVTIRWMGGTPWKDDFTRWLVMFIASVWWQTGTNFIIFSGALQSVPKTLYEACEMDGGGVMQKIFTVIIPNIKGSLALCLFNTLIGYLGLYGQPLVFAERENVNLFVAPMLFIQRYITDIAFARQTGFICAAGLVFGLITMIFTLVQQFCTKDRHPKAVHTACFTGLTEETNLINGISTEAPKTEEDEE